MKVDRNVSLTLWERLYLPAIFRGLFVTSRHFFRNLGGFFPGIAKRSKKRNIFTVYYPEEKVEYPPAYRGMPVLVKDSRSGEERCVACGLCEVVCPATCIDIQPGETESEKERYPETFNIDMSRCVFCGLCEEVCPKEAIVMSNKFEIAELDRSKMLLRKEQLLVTEKDVEERIKFIRRSYGACNY